MSTNHESRSRRPAAASRKDRRDLAAPRLRYEALVEVGDEEVGGFEAESVDVSLDGMRMRTAYLPENGQTLMCRFDGFGGEIVAEAEVVWCKAEARGGEFGIRFVGLDAHALTLLNDLCIPEPSDDEEAEPSTSSGVPVGTRVRLHIEGLGSPMRARIRETAQGEVLIGSNLEFLTVGRGVELEDVEHGQRRIAHIEHVGVDIDPESQVPQLIVALSYEPLAGALPKPIVGREQSYTDAHHGELTTAPYRTKVAPADDEGEAETTPEPTVIDSSAQPSAVDTDDDFEQLARPRRRARVAQIPPQSVGASDPEPPPTLHAEADDEHDDGDVDEDDDIEEALLMGAPGTARRATQKVGELARKLGPKLASAGNNARGALGSIMSSVRKRRDARRQAKVKAKMPMRVTAPAPTSAAKKGSRRALREQRSVSPARNSEQPIATDIELPDGVPAPVSRKKRTAISAVLAAMAVVAIYFASTQVRGMVSPSPDEVSVAAANTVATRAPKAPNFPGSPVGDATANVPLFGATPLSTTEIVPAPPAPGEASDAAVSSSQGAEPQQGTPAANLEKEWGVGEVNEPTVLRLKMDGTIQGLRGSETANGFTIVVPSRKSVSSAAGLARKDRRIDSVNVVNYPDRAEITLHFKKEVPAFMVRAKGKRLIIEIATKKKKKKKSKKSKKRKKKSKKKK